MYTYSSSSNPPFRLFDIFAATEVNNFGRAMVFLTMINKTMKGSADATRTHVSLVAVVFKDMDLTPFPEQLCNARQFFHMQIEQGL